MNAIRLARADEAGTVRDLVRAAYAHYVPRIGREPAPMTDDYARRIADGQAWVLERDGVLAGVVVLEETVERFLLDNVAVASAFRGTGVGQELLKFAEAEARRRGPPPPLLYTNAAMTENIALYGRIGYVETGRVGEKGFRRVYMAKGLAG